jgi:hypothetical protein
MISAEDIAAAELLLHDADFPSNYINMAHPDDYKAIGNPFATYISHFSGHNNRLILRACWKTSDNRYIPMSFVCDTGAPMGFYLSTVSTNILKRYNRILEDETGNEYVVVNGGKAAVEPTPSGHAPANIIGLRVLTKLELYLRNDGTFALTKMPEAF